MLLLFAGGVMNLAVILALTVWVVDREDGTVRRAGRTGGGRPADCRGGVDAVRADHAAAAASALFQSKS